MRGRYKLCTTNDEPTNQEGWPYSSIFHTRSENAIPLNASLSKTASNATYDQTKVENLKSLLFKDCHDSWTEFIDLCMNGRPSGVGEKRRRAQCDCCSCWYKQCNHYGDIKGLSKKSLAYYRAVCPMCVMTVSPSCSRFWDCCIVRLHFGKKFSSLLEAEAFACGCHHVKYEKSFIDFCAEGNIYENSRQHSLRYFLNIDHPEPLTSQRLSQLTVSREITSMMQPPSEHVAFLNPVCKPLMNGAKCANCENYDGAFKELFYVPLRPRTNEDDH